ncbi:hypothetical protein [Methylosinus sp. Ce-a6]|uniref:hypothetical protein n=1 Tax=Methylosinus sp. Ce-a6 TaxID=2172005 RepID=UPI00135AB024|nr:hypothetical protein [Methylosinus sp. Ce-a6]
MRFRSLAVLPSIALSLSAPIARADAEADRLREALRGAITQTRALEDQRASLQAKLTEVENAQKALKERLEATKADLTRVTKDYREAIEQYKRSIEEHDQTLEKWRTAYEEAADVARGKEAERAKVEGLANALKASAKNCVIRNNELVKVGRELLARYEGANFVDATLASEPLLGARRVEIQNLLQDYKDKILDQKVTP